MIRSTTGRTWWAAILLVGALTLSLLVGHTAIAAADVEGNFSGTYDGYNDGESTDLPGHEIQVRGTIEVTGDSAVNPRIFVTSTDWTVLDPASVEIFVPGERSIEFETAYSTRNGNFRVRKSTDEIPPDTTLRVEFVAYFVGGTTKKDINAANVRMRYETAGASQTDRFDSQTNIDNSPDRVIERLGGGDDGPGFLLTLILGVIVGIFVVGAGYGVYKAVSGTGPPT